MKVEQKRQATKKKNFQRIFFLLCLLFFLGHFGISIIYTLPKSYFPAKVNELAGGYMYPSFYQGWSLFAPDVPKWHSDLEYRYNKLGEWTTWQSTTTFPGGDGHPVQARIAQKLNHYLTNQLRENLTYSNGLPQFDKVVVQGHYRSAIYLIRAELKHLGISQIDSLQLKLNVSYAPEFGSGNLPEIKSIEYPILAIQTEPQ